MDNERIPNDPYGSGLGERDYSRHLDDEMRFDPDAREPISGTKAAIFAVPIAVVLGALFYGLNNTSVQQAQTSPPAQTAQSQPQPPAQAPPGMRDVTPRANTSPGVTTGQAPSSAPMRPATPDNNK
jgi:hypothetical protein